MNGFLGIDTSNYTTSVAFCGENGEIFSKRKLLEVKEGACGVRQSDAVFIHTKTLPALSRELFDELNSPKIKAVGVSGFPRRATGSYMPCFLAGVSVAASTAAFLKVPLYVFSHQEGHLAAAARGSNMALDGDFYAFHLSGGTLELLEVKAETLEEKLLMSSADITTGQLIDRCGVKMGLKFPCGAKLEELALNSKAKYKVKIPVRDSKVCIAGLENSFDKLFNSGTSKEDCAAFVFECVISTVEKMIEGIKDEKILFMGGVSSSQLMKQRLFSEGKRYFAPGEYSCDNAMGIALLAKSAYEAKKAEDNLDFIIKH